MKAFLIKEWYKFISHIVSLFLIFIRIFFVEYEVTEVISIDTLLGLSIAISFVFTINISINYLKYKNNYSISIQMINKYKTEIDELEIINKKYEVQVNTMIVNPTYNKNSTSPELAMDLVNYRIKGNLLLTKSKTSIELVDGTIKDIDGKTYYVVLNKRNVDISFDQQPIIADYIDSTMKWIETTSGTALTSKPRHLIIFKIINVGNKSAVAFYPRIVTDNVVTHDKNITPQMIDQNDYVLFYVLVECHPEGLREYKFELNYFDGTKNLVQSFVLNINKEKLYHEIILSGKVDTPHS